MTRPLCCHGNFKLLWSRLWSKGMPSSTRTQTANQMKSATPSTT
uniref:Uncharacterized protein n=1 Tax=Anguilla anguilla TaxID=7936 RepID=A0A0E9P9A0_ANGAN